MTVGRTRDAGWQIGVSRTLDSPPDRVWTVLLEDPGLWLAPGARLPDEVGAAWVAQDGTQGELRGRRHDRVRLTVRRPGAHETTVQVSVVPSGARTSVRFHEERMRDADERAARRAHWQATLDRLAVALAEDRAGAPAPVADRG